MSVSSLQLLVIIFICRHGYSLALIGCTNNEIRLVDGRDEFEGRLEVCKEGVWGTVCNDLWSTRSTSVACRQLEIGDRGYYVNTLPPASALVPILLTDVNCTGSERELVECPSSRSDGTVACRHLNDVRIACIPFSTPPECEEGALQMVDDGRLEVCQVGVWGTICNYLWDRNDATVACRQLGLNVTAAYPIISGNGEGPIHLSGVSCNGSEESIAECPISEFGLTILYDSCSHGSFSPDAAVFCSTLTGPSCADGELRLFDGPSQSQGRLEVCLEGTWGSVCNDGWISNLNGLVVCRELGFNATGALFGRFGEGPGPIHLSNVICNGTEDSIFNCTHVTIDDGFLCFQSEAVGVLCIGEDIEFGDLTLPVPEESTPETTLTEITSVIINTGPIIAVVALVLVFCCLLVVAVSGVCCAVRSRRRRRRKSMLISNQDLHRPLNSPVANTIDSAASYYNSPPGPDQPPLLSPSSVSSSFVNVFTGSFIIPLRDITLSTKLGEGEFGIVYKAKLSDARWKNQVVAVKTLKGEYKQEEVDSILEEGLKLKHFQHQNVLSLIGVCVEASPAPYIITPFMSNGSLLHYLRRRRGTLVLSKQEDEDTVEEVSKRLIVICQQISKGMKYLASQRFIHRDLAARNCMIDENFRIKIADFGLTEDIYTKLYFRQDFRTGVKLPVKWLALESLQEGLFSEKSDVWSFGVTCWEVFSGGKVPYPGVSSLSVLAVLEQGERLTRPNNAACTKEMYELMKLCWEQDPEERPTFSTLNEKIDRHLEEVAMYLNFESFEQPPKEEKQLQDQSQKGEGKRRGFFKKKSMSVKSKLVKQQETKTLHQFLQTT